MEHLDKNAFSVDVGSRLKELRQERGISIRALARMSGLSANALSMIERSRTSPSVSTLYKLADSLEVPITALFREIPQRQDVVFRKASERTRVSFMRGLFEGLGGEYFSGSVEPFMLTLESGGSSGPFGMIHTGHEFVFCLRGQLEYQVENQRFSLESGDSLLFAAKSHHRWRNTGKNVVNAIIVLSGFGHGEHPSEFHLASGIKSEEENPHPE